MIKRIVLGTLTALAVCLTARDAHGSVLTHTQAVLVDGNTPANVVASVDQLSCTRLGHLWSPDHTMTELGLTAGAIDDCHPEPLTWVARAAATEVPCDRLIGYVLG